METAFKLAKLADMMDESPKGQDIYNFFDGAVAKLDKPQRDNLRNIVLSETDKLIKVLDLAEEMNLESENTNK